MSQKTKDRVELVVVYTLAACVVVPFMAWLDFKVWQLWECMGAR